MPQRWVDNLAPLRCWRKAKHPPKLEILASSDRSSGLPSSKDPRKAARERQFHAGEIVCLPAWIKTTAGPDIVVDVTEGPDDFF
jgi:hypothetical protein